MNNSTNSAVMDYAEHERTYERFISLIKQTVVHVINVLFCLLLVGFGGGSGHALAAFLLFLTLVAAAIGLALGRRGWIPGGLVAFVGLVFIVLTVS